MIFKKTILLVSIFVLAVTGSIYSYDTNELDKLYHQLQNPILDVENTFDISHDTIYHHDFTLILDSGKIAFFEPVQIGVDSTVFGAYFEGYGQMLFVPSIQMERDQLNRFYHSDSLKRNISEMVLHFVPQIYDSLQNNLVLSDKKLSKNNKNMRNLLKRINEESDFIFTFELLRNLISPFGKPYLTMSFDTRDRDELLYMFNPYLREEIKLWRRYWEPGNSYTELINSYSQYNSDESYFNINGRKKTQLDIIHYDINSSIDRKGILISEAKVTASVLTGPLQLIQFSILPTIKIDSIKDNSGRNVKFAREELDVTFKDWESYQVALFLNTELFFGDTVTLNFYYHGEIAEKNLGEYYVFAKSNWYPKYGYRDRATFDLTFKTDKQYTFTSCGNLKSKITVGDTLVTSWSVLPEASNVSFNIGNLKKYLFEDKDIVPTEIYFSKELHNSFGGRAGKDMEKQVAEDIMNSMRVFNHYFGSYPYQKISVSEILARHGEAFPGFIHLGYTTWTYTDTWGYDRLFRAHEVAHQWWGVGVGYETYHDQWLSEGFSEYSALLYYQALTDNEKFLNKLKESRNNIFSARKYLFSTGEESGPIAMGHRTSSSKTSGDYNLIIYKKGAFILHMLRNLMIDLKTMNEDNFLEMLREFYGTYRGKEVNTKDFQRIAEKYAGIELDWFFDQWVYHNYLPEYEFSYEIVHNDSTKLLDAKCKITSKGVPANFKMYIPLEIQFDEKSKAYIRILVDSNNYEFDIPGLSKRPKKMLLNPFESVLAKIKQ